MSAPTSAPDKAKPDTKPVADQIDDDQFDQDQFDQDQLDQDQLDQMDDDQLDLYGNEIEQAMSDYRIDVEGEIYERHAPQVEVSRLAGPSL